MIALERVSVHLSRRLVVDAVTLQVRPGEWTTLIGPNGAGKTTLLRAVSGAIGRTGRVALAGDDPRSLSVKARAQRLAIVWQSPLLPPDMSVREYVMLGRTPHLGMLGRAGAHDRAVVGRVLARLDLLPQAARRLCELSGGERQRAILGRALAQDAPVLLLDEPTTALDVGRQQEVLELVAELRAERGLTVLSAMHDLTLAGQYADRVALLDGGKLIRYGPPAEVLTEEVIARHYGASVRVIHHEGLPLVSPVRSRTLA